MRFFNLFTPARTEIVNKKPVKTTYYSRSAENGADKVLSRGEENSSVHMTYVNFLKPRKSALDVTLYAASSGRSFFHRVLQIRRDFLTTCTQKSTRGKKSQVDVTLCGRSMVEMLGVLAIIGVLSVGAIAGYSKAMMKYKLNKQLEQISQLINTVYIYSPQIDTSETANVASGSFLPYFRKLNLIPDGMTDASLNALYDALKTRITIFSASHKRPKIVYTAMNYGGVADRSTILQSCIQIAELAKDYSITYERDFYGLYLSNVDSEGSVKDQEQFFGSSVVSNCKTARCMKDATIDEIYTACSNALGKNLSLSFIFYFR